MIGGKLRMSLAGFLIMAISWALIIWLAVFSLSRTFKADKQQVPPEKNGNGSA